MSKIILEFDGTEEQEEAIDALNGYNWKETVKRIDNILRSTTRHDVSVIENNPASELEIKIAERYRELIRAELDNRGLSMDN